MELGIIGLGRMGMKIGTRLATAGHTPYGFDLAVQKRVEAEKNSIKWRDSIPELVSALQPPRVLWLMVPAGEPVENAVSQALPHLSTGDIIIDGGNSYYKDSIRRAGEMKTRGVDFIDCGVSGGIWGLEDGYCLMVGGDEDAISRVEPILSALAQKDGYRRVGASGAGHFAKMVHNGIEYGILQAYGEGFDILNSSDFDLNLPELAKLWNRGSVIRSWLLELAGQALDENPTLDGITGYVEDSGEGRWTVFEAIDRDVPAPVITMSLLARFRSRRVESFSDKLIAAVRNKFGGHSVKKENPLYPPDQGDFTKE